MHRPIIWKRPSEIVNDPQMYVGGADRFDIRQVCENLNANTSNKIVTKFQILLIVHVSLVQIECVLELFSQIQQLYIVIICSAINTCLHCIRVIWETAGC